MARREIGKNLLPEFPARCLTAATLLRTFDFDRFVSICLTRNFLSNFGAPSSRRRPSAIRNLIDKESSARRSVTSGAIKGEELEARGSMGAMEVCRRMVEGTVEERRRMAEGWSEE